MFNHKRGTTLVETIIAIAILTILSLGIYSAFNLFFQVLAQKKNRTDALAVANEKMEIIHNLAYNNIGTVGGIPSGTIPQTEIVTRNNQNFTVQTQVAYVDDPFDGTLGGSPDDLLPADYKRIRISVSWPSRFVSRPINLISDIAPRGMESTLNGGTLAITVLDANGQPVETANVNIVNNSTNPAININTETNSQGKAIFPGAPVATDSYAITVTKTGYSTDQTYPRTPQMPNPIKPHASVIDKRITEVSFNIDLLSNLTIYTYSHTFINNWKINTDTGTADQAHPVIATDVNNNLYFSWQDDRQASDTRIYEQKYNSSLQKQWASDARISTANNQSHPSVAGDGAGNTYIAWQDDSNGNQDVYLLKINSSGSSAWTGSKKVNTDSGSADQTLPGVAIDGANLYITWTDYRNGESDVYLHKLDTNKNYLWASEVMASSDPSGNNQLNSKLLVLNHEIYVVWEDYRNSDSDIYMSKFDADGIKLWADDLRVNSDVSSGNQLSPNLATDGTNVYVTWSDTRNGDSDIYLQKIDPDGTKLWSSDILASNDGSPANALTPAIIVTLEPRVYLSWIDNRNSNNDLYTQTFDTEGNKVWDFDIKVNDDTGVADQEQPEMIIDNLGQVIYVWVDDRSGDYDVYASGYSGIIPTPLGNVSIQITGSKKISNSPLVYKYQQNFTTDAQGVLSLTGVEWDSYTVTTTGHTIRNADPGLPLNLNPNTNQTLRLFLD